MILQYCSTDSGKEGFFVIFFLPLIRNANLLILDKNTNSSLFIQKGRTRETDEQKERERGTIIMIAIIIR